MAKAFSVASWNVEHFGKQSKKKKTRPIAPIINPTGAVDLIEAERRKRHNRRSRLWFSFSTAVYRRCDRTKSTSPVGLRGPSYFSLTCIAKRGG